MAVLKGRCYSQRMVSNFCPKQHRKSILKKKEERSMGGGEKKIPTDNFCTTLQKVFVTSAIFQIQELSPRPTLGSREKQFLTLGLILPITGQKTL